MQIFVTIAVLAFVMGGLFAVTLSRKEGRELKKSCGCSVPGAEGEGGSCVNSCQS
jgi:hypothetical protein